MIDFTASETMLPYNCVKGFREWIFITDSTGKKSQTDLSRSLIYTYKLHSFWKH